MKVKLCKVLDNDFTLIDVKGEINQTYAALSKLKKASAKRGAYTELKSLKKEVNFLKKIELQYKAREKKVIHDVLSTANVILCTCIGAGNEKIKHLTFDTVVIDECSQALEAESWIALVCSHFNIHS